MRAISLFSGAGGMDVGFAQAGIHATLACEINRDAAATYRANHRGELFEGDIRNLIPTLHRGAASVVFGGAPCQGYSIAGKMDPNDPRNALVQSFMDVVDMVRPLGFVMENVDALALMPKWRGVLAAVRARAQTLGYATHVRVLNAAKLGVPQSRKRMFLWGVKGAAETDLAETCDRVLASCERPETASRSVFLKLGRAGSERNPVTCPARVTFARNPVLRASPYAGMLFNGAGRPIDPERPAPTIAASSGGNKTHIVDEDHIYSDKESFVDGYHARLMKGEQPEQGIAPSRLRRLTIAECLALQTFPESFVLRGKRASQYRQIGNAVPCLMASAVGYAMKAMIENATLANAA